MRHFLSARKLFLAALLLAVPGAVHAQEGSGGTTTTSCTPIRGQSYFEGSCEVWEIYTPCIKRLCIQRACTPGGDSEECFYFGD